MENCYACKGQFLFHDGKFARNSRYDATKYTDQFIGEMVDECNSLRNKIVRIHSSGDFYSTEYIETWIQIAKLCPDVTFFCYTRTWSLESEHHRAALKALSALRNVTLWFSVDPSAESVPDWPRISYIEGTKGAGKLSCKKQLDHTENCVSCGRCYNNRAKKVTFQVH